MKKKMKFSGLLFISAVFLVLACVWQGQKVAASEAGNNMYRMYNPNNGEHFYTSNSVERDHLAVQGWYYENIGWVAPTEGVAVYRLYNKNAGDHHYTTNEAEKNSLVSVGWQYEGIAWRSNESQGSPLYRLYNPNARTGTHHYTLSSYERDVLIRQGWQDEGIGWYGAATTEKNDSFSALVTTPYYNQVAYGAPMGCEAAALLQSLHGKGYANSYNLTSLLNEMPRATDNNPNNGFSGSPYVVTNNVFQSIYPEPLANWGKKYGEVVNISGSSTEALKQELRQGNSIVLYATVDFKTPEHKMYFFGDAIENSHIMTLAGYNDATASWLIIDPFRGRYWVNNGAFETAYNAKQFAVVVR